MFLLDDLQFGFLIRGLDGLFRYRMARQWPGFANKEAVEGARAASPKPTADTDYTVDLIRQECEAKGLRPPHG